MNLTNVIHAPIGHYISTVLFFLQFLPSISLQNDIMPHINNLSLKTKGISGPRYSQWLQGGGSHY